MKIVEARRWLAIYFLLTAAITGSYLLIFSGTFLLPLSPDDATASFQILIPVLAGQITVIFQWIALANNTPEENDLPSPIPGWAIKLPPTLAILIVMLAAVALVVSNRPGVSSSMSPMTFKNAVTFSVTILNSATIFLVARLFPKKPE
jgi:hypothetical protein